jgi:hypothetical protein
MCFPNVVYFPSYRNFWATMFSMLSFFFIDCEDFEEP